jgi:Tfp pilus assembly protein PilE
MFKLNDVFAEAQEEGTQRGVILATLMAFIPVIVILSTIVLTVALQSYRTTIQQEYIRQAQLASITASDFAKEQYELDIAYTGTAGEETLYETDDLVVTYEVVSKGYSNAINTQQDIQAIGRVYKKGSAEPLYTREIQGKITNTTAGTSSVRFIFIVDNSGSMSVEEWLDSKTTVDAAIDYVLANVPSAEVAVLQYGTNHYSQEHKYDVTVPFTNDEATATTWDRRFGPGSSSTSDLQDHLPGSLARMRLESVYGPGDELDLVGATDVQYVLFTDAVGINTSWCCSSLKKVSGEPSGWHDNNGAGYSILADFGEYNALKDGTVFNDDGYPGLTSQFTVLSINQSGTTPAVSAAIASPGGTWTGAVDSNTGDPEGNGIVPRRFISTTLSAGPDEIISVLNEIIEQEINF